RLMPQPQPGEFDRGSSGAGVAGFGNPLIALHSTARPRARGETEISSDFATVTEIAKKYLVGQYRGTHQADAPQADEPCRPTLLRVGRCRLLGLDFGNQDDDLV